VNGLRSGSLNSAVQAIPQVNQGFQPVCPKRSESRGGWIVLLLALLVFRHVLRVLAARVLPATR